MRFIQATAICLIFVSGCGHGDQPVLGRVVGTVTLDGRPLEGANVMFQPKTSGRGSFGLTDATGRYDLIFTHDVHGALIGAHGVQIFTARDPVVEADDTTMPGQSEILPARYNRASVLTADVRSGSNTIDFALDSNEAQARKTSGK